MAVEIARTKLKIVPEKRALNIFTSIGEYDENCVEANLDIVCCPFCGRKFDNGTEINND